MGQSVLANQFIAGLRSDLKSKVVGVEGSLEQLLLKARSEEAKKRELRELSLRTLPLPQGVDQGALLGQLLPPKL